MFGIECPKPEALNLHLNPYGIEFKSGVLTDLLLSFFFLLLR